MADEACLYCKGTKEVRHKRPPGFSEAAWDRLTSGGKACPLCRGSGKAGPSSDMPRALVGLFVVQDREGRALLGCPTEGCPKWAEITRFLREKSRFVSQCPSGHKIELDVEG